MIGLYYNPETGLYRIVALDVDTSDVTLNVALVADTEYQQASERFHQFSDHEGKVRGINFASDEVRFFERQEGRLCLKCANFCGPIRTLRTLRRQCKAL